MMDVRGHRYGAGLARQAQHVRRLICIGLGKAPVGLLEQLFRRLRDLHRLGVFRVGWCHGRRGAGTARQHPGRYDTPRDRPKHGRRVPASAWFRYSGSPPPPPPPPQFHEPVLALVKSLQLPPRHTRCRKLSLRLLEPQ